MNPMHAHKQWARSCLSSLALLAVFSAAWAQTSEKDSDSRYRETYAIVGAKIEVGDGRVIDKGTVLVRDGRIREVGTNVKVPSYAYTIKGDGLVVYPGFIDASARGGLKLPEPQNDQDVKPDETALVPAAMREANRKGVRPELKARDYLDLSNQALLGERKTGFAVALLSPSGGMINGVPTLVCYSGRPARECVMLPEFGMSMGWGTGGRGGYPATSLGTTAHIRQTLMDAQRAATTQSYDPVLLALQPVLVKSTPVLFEADQSGEIERTLGVIDQFGLRAILVGGTEAHKQIAAIQSHNVPVILSINFPAEPMPAEKKEEGKGKDDKKKPEKKESDIPEDVRKERQEKWLERVRAAKALNEKGVQIAFCSRGVKNGDEFWKNLRRAIQEGLPREAALRALALNPARMFGVDREVGTVETGKKANLTIMSGDFAKDDSKVKYMIVDGWLYKPEQDKSPTAAPRRFDDDFDDGHGHSHGQDEEPMR